MSDRAGEDPTDHGGFAPGAKALFASLGVAAAWVVWGLARHPEFQPTHALRVVAPIVALGAGGAFVRWVARARRRVDEAREFDPGGKALFMGFVMVTATLLAWLLLSQAIPATLTALTGIAQDEPGLVTRKVPATSDADCRFRLEVRSVADAGAVPRPLDECVDEALWQQAAASAPVTLRLVGGALGAELVGIAPAGASR